MTITRRELLKAGLGVAVLPPVITFPGLLADPPAESEAIESNPGPCGSLQELMDAFSAEIEEAIPGCRACCLASDDESATEIALRKGHFKIEDSISKADLESPSRRSSYIVAFQHGFKRARA